MKIMFIVLILVVSALSLNYTYAQTDSTKINPPTEETFWQSLDKTLDATLAGTLAGLSLAVLAFVFTLAEPIDNKIKTLEKSRTDAQTPEHRKGIDEEINYFTVKQTKLKTVIGSIYKSVFCFLFFLLMTMSIDIVADKATLLQELPFDDVADLLLTGSPLVIGIIFLWRGASNMKNFI